MRVYENAWHSQQAPRRGRHALVWVAVLVFLLLASLYAVRFVTINLLRYQVADLSAEEAVALTEQADLRAQFSNRDDLETIERIARDKLGLVKPGEEKVIFIEGD
jgi:cell division protein FtsB